MDRTHIAVLADFGLYVILAFRFQLYSATIFSVGGLRQFYLE